MKKKFLVALMAIMSVFALAFGLTACGENPHEHIYETTVTAPTCTEQGYTTHACSCGDSYVDSYVNALGHNFTNYVSDGNATCTADGTKTATCDREGCNETHTVTDEGSKLKSGISFKTLSVSGTDVYGKVSNTTETFSFINEVTALGTAKYVVALDIYGSQQVATKTIPLSIGDNTVYIIETIDGEPINVYAVTVRRRPMYEVTFNTTGGSDVESQTIEEDSFAVKSETIPTRTGYTFSSWDFDFNTPIMQNTTINAAWTVNQYTITFVYGNGQDNKVIKQDYNTPIESIEELESIAGYGFCWDKEVPATMPAEDIVITGYWTPIFTLSGGMITGLTDYGRNHCSVLNIPSQIDGVAITSIGSSAFYNHRSLTSVIIPDSVTSIGNRAFYWCNGLMSVTIGNSVTSIGDEAFDWCFKLMSVTIGKSVVSIGDSAFGSSHRLIEVKNLSSLSIATGASGYGGIGKYAKRVYTEGESYLSTENTYIIYNDGTDKIIVGYTGKETQLVLSSDFTQIYNSAFSNCDSLTSVIIPDSVTSIGDDAFSNCSSLTSVTIPDSVTSIGSYAFYNCSGLTSVVIPDSVTSIGEGAFYNCSKLTSVTFENTSGWRYSTYSTATSGTSISSTDLADPSTAATYLKTTYCDYYWKRS